MKLRNETTKSQMLKAAMIVAVAGCFAACTKGGSISSGSSSSTTITGTLTVTDIYPTSQGATWTPITSGGRYYIKGLQLTMTGTCTAGTNTIQVNEGGSNYSEQATCTVDGFWTFQKTYTSGSGEGDKTLTIAGYDINNQVVQGTSTTQTVRIDNTAPTAPVVTTPASSPYIYSNGTQSFNIVGNCTADTDHLTLTGPLITPSPMTVACSGGSFNYTVPLTPGGSQSFTFYAWDLAGNQSVGTVQTIDYIPSLSLTMETIGGGHTTDSGTSGDTLESSNSMILLPQATDGSSNDNLYTGFNYIINQARAQ